MQSLVSLYPVSGTRINDRVGDKDDKVIIYTVKKWREKTRAK